MLDLLFVYGTLRSAFDNAYALLLRANSEFVGPRVVRGRVHQFERYPAFRPEGEGAVAGELYRLLRPEATLAELDAYEGEEYERIVIDAGGDEAWIYSFRTPLP